MCYLLRLAELELIDRKRRMVERRIKAARFPIVKSLDSLDFKAIPSLNRALVLELARCKYIGRLTHHVHFLEMNGQSFRLKQSKIKTKPKPAHFCAATGPVFTPPLTDGNYGQMAVQTAQTDENRAVRIGFTTL